MSGAAGKERERTGAGAAVQARSLRKAYGRAVAVDGIDFTVERGTCVGFLGANGAGKTTTMKMIYGLASVDDGELLVLGQDMRRDSRAAKRHVGVVPQHDNLDGELSVRDNLLIQAMYHGLRRREAAERTSELLAFAGLGARGSERPEALSGGMRRRLLIARALVGRPALVVLDEPTTGLDPQARKAIWHALDGLLADGVTLLVSTHYMEEASRLCERLLIMDQGRIVAEGAPAELVERHGEPDLESVFLTLTREELVT